MFTAAVSLQDLCYEYMDFQYFFFFEELNKQVN